MRSAKSSWGSAYVLKSELEEGNVVSTGDLADPREGDRIDVSFVCMAWIGKGGGAPQLPAWCGVIGDSGGTEP